MPKMPPILQKLKPKPKPQAQPKPAKPKGKPLKDRLREYGRGKSETLSTTLHEKLPFGAMYARKFVWPIWGGSARIDKVRSRLRNYKDLAQQELAAKEQDHGSLGDVYNAYVALYGGKVGYIAVPGRVFKKQFRMKAITQRGLLDVLKDAKKFGKMSEKKLEKHIADVEGLKAVIGAISNSHGKAPGEIKTVHTELSDYLVSLKDLKDNKISAGDIQFDAKSMLDSVKQQKAQLKASAKVLGQLERKRAAYESAEYFSNALGYWRLSKMAGETPVGKFAAFEKRAEELRERDLAGKLSPAEKLELERSEESMKALVKQAQDNGTLTTFGMQMPTGENVKVVYIPESRLSERVKKLRDSTRRGHKWGPIGTFAGAVLATLAAHAGIATAKMEALKAENAAERATNEALQSQLGTWNEAARQQASQNEILRQIIASQQAAGVLPPGESGAPPIDMPGVTPLPPGEAGVAPVLPAYGATTAAAAASWYLAGPVFAPVPIVGGLAATPAIARVWMKEGDLIGRIRRLAVKDSSLLFKPAEVPESLRGSDKAAVAEGEKQALALLKSGSKPGEEHKGAAYKADYFTPPDYFAPGSKGLFVFFRKGEYPQAI